ncbi:MAG: hypothetical protein QOF50_384 [Gaiellaceae bacterium]|nr:hypothetical protein [Gaiellaceae bacterium]
MKRVIAIVVALTAAIALIAAYGGTPATGGRGHGPVIKAAAQGKLKPAKLTTTINGRTVTKTMPFFSDAAIAAAQEQLGIGVPNLDERGEAADASGTRGDVAVDGSGGNGTGAGPAHGLSCGGRDGKGKGNTRVNQDCTYRRQAEEEIVYNPADPNNLIAGQNDSRVGFNQCGTDFSTNNGKNWGDELPPFRQKVNFPALEEPGPSLDPPVPGDPNRHTIRGGDGTFHTYDAGSDPALAMDNQGYGYFSCVAFDVFSNASLLYVTASPPGAEGSFYFNIAQFGRRYVVAEDNSPEIFHDKNFITADYYASSPNKGNVYVTWTVFRFGDVCDGVTGDGEAGYCESPIFGSMSTDHGHTFSTPELVSGTSTALCSFGNAFDPASPPSACNFDQGSDPITLPNGDLEVIFNNGNTAATNPNAQQLGVHCHPTGSSPAGTAHLNCASPAKVGDDVIAGEPQCDFGRGPEECIPGAYIRTNDFPRINTQNGGNNHLYATWQDYRNGEFDIQMSVSTNGGLTWQEVGTVNPDRGLDHYFPAVEQSPSLNDRVGVSYYRTERVPNENTTPPAGFAPGDQPGVMEGNSDYVLAGGTFTALPYDFKVVSPVFPPPDGIQAGFNGDYSGLAINKGADAHPIWSDTRNVNPYPENGVVHDEDVFTDNTGLPNGKAKVGTGTVGKR